MAIQKGYIMYTILAADVAPRKATAHVDDGRVGQQIFYAAGIISNVINSRLGDHAFFTYASNDDVQENPWFSWAGESKENFLWMCEYLSSALKRYKEVTGKDHKSKRVLTSAVAALESGLTFKRKLLTEFPNTASHPRFGLDFTGEENSAHAYKLLLEAMYKAQKTPVKFNGKEAVKYRSKAKPKAKAKAKPKADRIEALVAELKALLD